MGCVWSRGAEDTVPVSKAVMRSVESKPVTVVIIFHLSGAGTLVSYFYFFTACLKTLSTVNQSL